MKTYKIKITGSGTIQEIREALIQLADDIRWRGPAEQDPGPLKQYEDPTLFSEFEEEEDEV